MLDWFEPSLTSSESPPWLDNYSNFIGELKNNFGPHNPKGKAEADFKNLKMRDNQRIMKYLVNFNRLAAHVQWGNTALCQQMYCRLLSHSAPAPHQPYNLKIELEEGTSPLFGPIYSLSQSELKSP